ARHTTEEIHRVGYDGQCRQPRDGPPTYALFRAQHQVMQHGSRKDDRRPREQREDGSREPDEHQQDRNGPPNVIHRHVKGVKGCSPWSEHVKASLRNSKPNIIMALSAGTKAPDFTLKTKTAEGLSDIKLSDNFGKRNTVILFFPLAFTGVCTQEMCDVSGG